VSTDCAVGVCTTGQECQFVPAGVRAARCICVAPTPSVTPTTTPAPPTDCGEQFCDYLNTQVGVPGTYGGCFVGGVWKDYVDAAYTNTVFNWITNAVSTCAVPNTASVSCIGCPNTQYTCFVTDAASQKHVCCEPCRTLYKT